MGTGYSPVYSTRYSWPGIFTGRVSSVVRGGGGVAPSSIIPLKQTKKKVSLDAGQVPFTTQNVVLQTNARCRRREVLQASFRNLSGIQQTLTLWCFHRLLRWETVKRVIPLLAARL